jgi:multidrug efflux pump subunit AcrA (membrane-fusion protein)
MMRTEIDLPNDEKSPAHGRLREGMYGVATIHLHTPTGVLTVPASCVTGRDEQEKAKVFVVRDGRAREIPVRTGTDNGLRVEILAGLNPDDQVILSPGSVSDGMPVRPVAAAVAQADASDH